MKSLASVLALSDDRPAISRRLGLGLGAEIGLGAGRVVIGHARQVIDPVAAPGVIALDEALDL